jgi:glycosyltransferase involved in cell wall biosynthesis
MKNKNISIIIPAYNEEGAIKSVVNSLINDFPDVELLVINDGSDDRTGELAEKAGARVIHHEYNLGYGSALRTGILNSSNDYVLFCDADGQHRNQDVKKIIELAEEYDMVVGTRGSDSHVHRQRKVGKWILKVFANYLAGCKIPDLNSGLRVMKKDILIQYLHLMPHGFSFSTTSTFAFLKGNRRIYWEPIKVHERVGKSTVRQLKHGPQTIMLMLKLTMLFNPLKIFLTVTSLNFLMLIVSFIWDMSLNGGMGISDTTVLLTLSTVLIFLFGLLADQLASLRREMHEKL